MGVRQQREGKSKEQHEFVTATQDRMKKPPVCWNRERERSAGTRRAGRIIHYPEVQGVFILLLQGSFDYSVYCFFDTDEK